METLNFVVIICLWIHAVCSGNIPRAVSKSDNGPVNVSGTVDSTNIIIWDRDKETTEEFQGKFCHTRCNGREMVNSVSSDRCLQCFPCTCDRFCAIEGTCCPQVDSEWLPPPTQRSQCKQEFQGGQYIRHVVTCDQDFLSSETRKMCESKSLPRRRDTHLPITSFVTGVTYTNIHCATCNYDNDSIAEWEITCRHNQYLYNATNDAEYDERALQLPRICGFSRNDSLDGLSYHVCSPNPDPDIITLCNVTKEWAEEDYDQNVRKACEESTWSGGAVVTLYGMHGFRTYSNLFCALCNGEANNVVTCKKGRLIVIPVGPKGPPGVRPVTGLISPSQLDVPLRTTVTLGDCPDGKWPHPQGECRELKCSAGKKLDDKRQSCQTAVRRVRGLGYILKLLLVPVKLLYVRISSSITSITVTHSATTTPITTTLSSTTGSSTTTETLGTATTTTTGTTNYDSSIFSAVQTPGSTVSMPSPYCEYGVLLNDAMSTVATPDEFFSVNITTAGTSGGGCFTETYRSQLEKLMKHKNITRSVWSKVFERLELDIAENAQHEAAFLTAKLEGHVIAPDSLQRDSFEETVLKRIFSQDWTVNFNGWTVKLRPLDMSTAIQGGGKEQTDLEVFGISEVDKKDFHPNPWNPLTGLEQLYLPLSNRLLCPVLSFEREEFELNDLGEDGGMQVKFAFYMDSDLKPISFEVKKYSNKAWLTENEQLVLCKDAYLDIFPSNVTVIKPGHGTSLVRQVISGVCSSISVVCLVLTLLTYALFRELRTLPGLNNMGLSGTLATAQLSLLIPWHRTDNTNVCRAVGVFTHWVWLKALSWMGVCCLHMVRVFISKTRHTMNKRQVKTAFLCNIIFTASLSTCIVTMTILVTSAVSGGTSMGYGGSICFLDTGVHPLLILAFMLPLGLLVIANLTCFVVTVASIMRVRRLQAQSSRERRDVLVYVKLVTVTGGAWVLGFLAELVDEEWMRVLAELCTAAQGLMLFLAYVCNVRVWRLYKARFGYPPPEHTSTSATVVQSTGTTKSTQV